MTLSGNLASRYQALSRDFELQTGTASSVSCVTAENPPTAVSASIGGTGIFSVDLSSVEGKGLSCSVLDSSSPPEVLGTFLYENSDEKSMGGDSKKVETVAFAESKDLGTLNLEGGQFLVDAKALNISTTGTSVTAAEGFDPSGNWVIEDGGVTLPAGYVGPCDDPNNCNGPVAGQNLYIQRFVGKNFTPDSTCQTAASNGTISTDPATNSDPDAECAGTQGTDDAFALSIWMSRDNTPPLDAFKACGDANKGTLGFTIAQARGYAGIDFSGDSSGTVLYTPFQWATTTTTTGGGNTITDGWQDSNATSDWPIMNCGSVQGTLGGVSTTAWRCFDDNNNFNFSVGGGCSDLQGKPIHLKDTDWSTVDWDGGNCSSSNVNFIVSGVTYSLQSNSCPATYDPVGGTENTPITCGGTWGTFKANNSAWDWNTDGAFTPTELAAQEAPCSSIVGALDTHLLSKYQCYSNHYWQTNYSSDKCMREIRTNWGATTAADFLIKDGPGRPRTLAVMEKMTYLSNDVATFTQYEDDYRGIQVKDSNEQTSWLACQTKAKNTINVTKISATEMLIKFVQETSLADTKDACKAAALTEGGKNTLNLGETRMLFKMTKQS